MITRKCDVAIVGSGPAGLRQQLPQKKQRQSVLIIERDISRRDSATVHSRRIRAEIFQRRIDRARVCTTIYR